MKNLVIASSLLTIISTPLAAEPVSAPVMDVPAALQMIQAVLDHEYPSLDALYKDIHSHPEIAFQERRTAARLAKEMRALGLNVTEGVGGTGVVALLQNGPGPTVLIRTDLDALPLTEKTGLPWASKETTVLSGRTVGVMHACGHDINMTAWVGAARALVKAKSSWSGTIMFVGQPAEEIVSGARAMLDDRFLERFGKPDYGFALHVLPFPAGQIWYRPGILSSNSDTFSVNFKGKGGHGSMPHATVDPVTMAARFTIDVQSIIAREKDPFAFGVVSVGEINAGATANVIPDSARVQGTIRTFDAAVQNRIHDGIIRTANGVAVISGAPTPVVSIVRGGKSVVNDPDLTARTAKLFTDVFGDRVHLVPMPGAASEDYSEFVLATGMKSLYFGIGGIDPQAFAAAASNGLAIPAPHSPEYVILPEPTIRTAVETMTLAVLNLLGK